MGLLVTRRAFFLMALIPLAFLPFSYARIRLQAALERLLSRQASTARLLFTLTSLGVMCDVIMVAQLLNRPDQQITEKQEPMGAEPDRADPRDARPVQQRIGSPGPRG